MNKEYDPEDPMELVGVALPQGEPEQMIESVVLEYLLLGWSPKQVRFLFQRPFFAGTYQLSQEHGEARVVALVDRICEDWEKGWENARKGVTNA